nr:hypothetical protein BHI3_08850 [Bacteriovorax sp. HI3]
MSFEQQVEAVRIITGLEKIEVKTEAGCRFLYLPQFFKTKSGELVDCLFACDTHQGYSNRLWFAKDLSCEIQANWNHKNFCIIGRLWSAFSMKGKGATLSEILLSHLAGAR